MVDHKTTRQLERQQKLQNKRNKTKNAKSKKIHLIGGFFVKKFALFFYLCYIIYGMDQNLKQLFRAMIQFAQQTGSRQVDDLTNFALNFVGTHGLSVLADKLEKMVSILANPVFITPTVNGRGLLFYI